MATLRLVAVILVLVVAQVVSSFPRNTDDEIKAWIRALRSDSTCSGKSYDPDFKICCNGNINWKGAGKTSCCGSVNYDPDFRVCCNGNILFRGAGKTKCCGNVNYDPDFRMCCGGVLYSKSTKCCRNIFGQYYVC